MVIFIAISLFYGRYYITAIISWRISSLPHPTRTRGDPFLMPSTPARSLFYGDGSIWINATIRTAKESSNENIVNRHRHELINVEGVKTEQLQAHNSMLLNSSNSASTHQYHQHLMDEKNSNAPSTKIEQMDAFEDFLWDSYNRYASPSPRNDTVDHSTAPQQQNFQSISNETLSPPPSDSRGCISYSSGSDSLHSGSSTMTPPTEVSAATATSTMRSPQLRTRGRPRRKSSNKDEFSEDADFKKPCVQKRERNRISARKCRQRTKSKLSDLETQAEEMQLEHEDLLETIKDLQYELIATQVECMEHIRCHCPEVKAAMTIPSASVKRPPEQCQYYGQD
jgi:hypothetical protein